MVIYVYNPVNEPKINRYIVLSSIRACFLQQQLVYPVYRMCYNLPTFFPILMILTKECKTGR
jgi:hypothetical protein